MARLFVLFCFVFFVYLENGVLSVVLVTDSEQFAVLLARSEPQLNLGHELVGVKRKRVFHVTLRTESRRYGGRQAVGARPAGVALASRIYHTAHARPVFRTPVTGHLHAQIFRLRTSGDAVPGESGIGQIVKLHGSRRQILSLVRSERKKKRKKERKKTTRTLLL